MSKTTFCKASKSKSDTFVHLFRACFVVNIKINVFNEKDLLLFQCMQIVLFFQNLKFVTLRKHAHAIYCNISRLPK